MQHPEWNEEKVEKDLDLNLNPIAPPNPTVPYDF